jgi:hypothetical protein
MERCSSDQRIDVHRRPQREHGVYVELHGHGRHNQSKRDSYRNREQQWNRHANLGGPHEKYRWNTGDDAIRIPHLLRHQPERANAIDRDQQPDDHQLRNYRSQ